MSRAFENREGELGDQYWKSAFSSGNRVSWAGSQSPICNEKIDWFTAFMKALASLLSGGPLPF